MNRTTSSIGYLFMLKMMLI